MRFLTCQHDPFLECCFICLEFVSSLALGIGNYLMFMWHEINETCGLHLTLLAQRVKWLVKVTLLVIFMFCWHVDHSAFPTHFMATQQQKNLFELWQPADFVVSSHSQGQRRKKMVLLRLGFSTMLTVWTRKNWLKDGSKNFFEQEGFWFYQLQIFLLVIFDACFLQDANLLEFFPSFILQGSFQLGKMANWCKCGFSPHVMVLF